MAAYSNKPNDLALKVLIKVDPAQRATCVVLDVSDAAGEGLISQELVRGSKNEFVVGIKRGTLPASIKLVARGYISSDRCSAPRGSNGDRYGLLLERGARVVLRAFGEKLVLRRGRPGRAAGELRLQT